MRVITEEEIRTGLPTVFHETTVVELETRRVVKNNKTLHAQIYTLLDDDNENFRELWYLGLRDNLIRDLAKWFKVSETAIETALRLTTTMIVEEQLENVRRWMWLHPSFVDNKQRISEEFKIPIRAVSELQYKLTQVRGGAIPVLENQKVWITECKRELSGLIKRLKKVTDVNSPNYVSSIKAIASIIKDLTTFYKQTGFIPTKEETDLAAMMYVLGQEIRRLRGELCPDCRPKLLGLAEPIDRFCSKIQQDYDN